MLLARQYLEEKEYKRALAKGVRIFLYNEIAFSPISNEEVILFNCTTERVPSTWYTWKKNEEVLECFKLKHPQFFQWQNYNFSLAFLKALYWSNQKTGFIQYVKNKHFFNVKVWKEDSLYDSKYLNVFLKYYFALFKHKTKNKESKSIEKNGKIGFLLKNEFQVTLYKNLITQIINNENILFFVMSDTVNKAIIKLGIKNNQIVYCNTITTKKIPLINYFSLKKDERFILNQIINNWDEVEKWTGVAEQMVSQGISKALINEAENGLYGAVIGEVFRKHGVVSFNTMNGMKAGQSQDTYINFDYWFVWDEKMKQLLMNKNNISGNKLIVTGHLMEDEVREYKYKNSLPLNEELILGKKVVSIFSTRGKREEKIEAFEFIYNQAELNKDYIFLIRLHPSEIEEDIILPPHELNNVYTIKYTQENSKITLYDQLLVSHLSICFGSTVALESKWFGVPCITFEKRVESLIYAVDNTNIFHVKSINSLTKLYFSKILNIKKGYDLVYKTSEQIINNLDLN